MRSNPSGAIGAIIRRSERTPVGLYDTQQSKSTADSQAGHPL
jgi:hypothetical protein